VNDSFAEKLTHLTFEYDNRMSDPAYNYQSSDSDESSELEFDFEEPFEKI